MTKHPTTPNTTIIPQPDGEQELRLSAARQQMQVDLDKVTAIHELIYNAIVEANPTAAAMLEQAHQALTTAGENAHAVSRAASYYQQLARDALTVAGQLDDERTRIKHAITTQDTMERTYGFGNMLTEVMIEAEAFAIQLEHDEVWTNLQSAGVASQGELIDWLFNATDYAYDADDYEAMADQCDALAAYFRDLAANGD